MTHPNSSISNKRVDKEARYKQILDVLATEGRGMTDRQLKDYLGLNDMNEVRPRVTELKQMGKVKELRNVMCRTTGRPVRLVTLTDGGLF